MGKEHFRQLHEIALREDQRALPWAIARHMEGLAAARGRKAGHASEALAFSASIFWTIPFDRVMHLSRGLAELDSEFTHALQTRLVKGQLRVKLMDPHTGKMLSVKDPDYFTFDDPVMTASEFSHYLLHYPQSN